MPMTDEGPIQPTPVPAGCAHPAGDTCGPECSPIPEPTPRAPAGRGHASWCDLRSKKETLEVLRCTCGWERDLRGSPPPDPLPSDRGYKAPWLPGERNEAFWREVLEGRTIKELLFDEKGVAAFMLDDGQRVELLLVKDRATLAIKD
jgi:hypothetical protein